MFELSLWDRFKTWLEYNIWCWIIDAPMSNQNSSVSPPLEPLPLSLPPMEGDPIAIDLVKDAWNNNRVKRVNEGIQVSVNNTWLFRPNGFMRQGSIGAAFWVAAKDLQLEP